MVINLDVETPEPASAGHQGIPFHPGGRTPLLKLATVATSLPSRSFARERDGLHTVLSVSLEAQLREGVFRFGSISCAITSRARRVQIATGEDRLVQFGIGARAARQRTRQRAFCVVSGSSRASVSTTREPLNNVGGAPVGRKNGVENMCYYPVFYYEREAL